MDDTTKDTTTAGEQTPPAPPTRPPTKGRNDAFPWGAGHGTLR